MAAGKISVHLAKNQLFYGFLQNKNSGSIIDITRNLTAYFPIMQPVIHG